MNLKEENTERIERLIREAGGTASEGEEYDERYLTRIIKEDDEVMILQLHPKEDGPVWKRTKVPQRGRSSVTEERYIPMLMPVPKDGSRHTLHSVASGGKKRDRSRRR